MDLSVYGAMSAVNEVQGLFISDLSVTRTPEKLKQHGITHVLSLTNHRKRPVFDESLEIQQLYLPIEDNPYEDLLIMLDGLCAWIDDALSSGGVLVHCIQGISRSGAIIIAYLMRKLSLDYGVAYGLARKSRSVIVPNSGFAEQLRIWQKLAYTVYCREENGVLKLKSEYEEWRANRGILLSRDEEARQQEMKKSMADLAFRLTSQRKFSDQAPKTQSGEE